MLSVLQQPAQNVQEILKIGLLVIRIIGEHFFINIIGRNGRCFTAWINGQHMGLIDGRCSQSRRHIDGNSSDLIYQTRIGTELAQIGLPRPKLYRISSRKMANWSSVLRELMPSTKVFVVERAAEMSSSRPCRSLHTTSKIVG